MKRRNMAIRLIRKQARGFRVGEWLYLFGCNHPEQGLIWGSYLINEIKRQSDETVTFLCVSRVAGAGTKSSHGWIAVEFPRDYELHRLAGEPLNYIIREDEFT